MNVFPIPLPPLRERREDIALLVGALLKVINTKHGMKVTDASKEAMERLREHSWPGNVRELRNVVERAAILAGEGTIGVQHLPPGFGGAPLRTQPVSSSDNELKLPVGTTIEQAERALIELTLTHLKNNRTRAAEVLGISQKTLFNKLKEYGSAAGGE